MNLIWLCVVMFVFIYLLFAWFDSGAFFLEDHIYTR